MAEVLDEIPTEGLAGIFEADAVKDQAPSVYEVGYHLLPSLSESDVQSAVKDLGNFLKKQGATMVGEKMPEMIDLAYAIEKRVAGRIEGFRTAHFGWVAFELSPSAIGEVKKFMDAHQSVLRYLIVTTSVDEVKAVMEGKVLVPKAQSSTEAIAAPKRAEEAGASGEVTDADLDKALGDIEEK